MDQKTPTTYEKLLEIRKSQKLKLNPNSYLKNDTILRYYQIQMVAHLFIVKRFMIGEDTGLGKSIEVIAAYCYMLEKDPSLKMIIVSPSSALYQWADEFDKFTNNIHCQIVESEPIRLGRGRVLTSFDSREYQFKQFEDNNKNVLIFNYNTLVTDNHILIKLLEKYKAMVVFDEATAFKNTKTRTFTYASELAKKADRVYGLTATMIKNNIEEAYSIFKVIVPGLFGSIVSFTRDYCEITKKTFWKGKGRRKIVNVITGYKNLDHFKKVIDPYFLGRKKALVAKELPEIITKEIKFNMNIKQQNLYDDVLKGFLDFNKFNWDRLAVLLNEEDSEDIRDIKYIDKLAALIYCQQICNSPKTLGFDIASSKEDEFIKLIKTELMGEKIVVYTRFRKMIVRMGELLKEENIPYTWISGELKSQTREENKKTFNESADCNIILINSAAKEAINLQSSGNLLFFDMPFSYGDFLQIIGRIHRIGNKHHQIFLTYLMCNNSVDEKVYKILNFKKKLFDEVLGDSAVGALKEDYGIASIFNDLLEEAKKLS